MKEKSCLCLLVLKSSTRGFFNSLCSWCLAPYKKLSEGCILLHQSYILWAHPQREIFQERSLLSIPNISVAFPWICKSSASCFLHQLRVPLTWSEVAGCFQINSFSQTAYDAISPLACIGGMLLKASLKRPTGHCLSVCDGWPNSHFVEHVLALNTESDCKGVNYVCNWCF